MRVIARVGEGARDLRFAGVLATLLAPTARATWGNKCSAGNGHHCYGIAEWSMSGSGNGGGEELRAHDLIGEGATL